MKHDLKYWTMWRQTSRFDSWVSTPLILLHMFIFFFFGEELLSWMTESPHEFGRGPRSNLFFSIGPAFFYLLGRYSGLFYQRQQEMENNH